MRGWGGGLESWGQLPTSIPPPPRNDAPDCNAIVLIRLKVGGGVLGVKLPPETPSLKKCLLGLYILPYGPVEVRMSNLGVRLGFD